jgi:hypothetical protein
MDRFPHLRCFALAGAVVLSAGAFTSARAQADPGDVKRAVARVNLINGDVSVRRGDSGDWVVAVINAPLLSSDDLVTGQNSRAEIEFDASNVLRIGGDAEVKFAQLEYGRYQLDVARGTVTFRVLRPTSVEVEVNTPSISVRPSKLGTYRITVSPAGESEVTARAGSVEVFTPTGSQWVNAGQTLMARGASADPEFQIVNAIPPDDWDRWNDARDGAELASTSYQYVPEGVYGAEDLDQSGNWEYVPDYGYCWQPIVAAGWAPYSLGRWVWEDWYGWTWISYDPWGWAPYHYGRWFNRPGFGWYWYPGARGRHYWSPALVGFMGWGGGGLGFGFGYIGWAPLAPYELFYPWWGGGYYGRPGYINRNLSIASVGIGNIYRNASFMNGITAVRGADFQGGRFTNVAHFTGSQIRDVSVVRGGMPVAPGAANLRFSDRAVAGTPRTSANTHFFTRQQPSTAAQRIPFAQQQRAFEQAGMPVRGGVSGVASAARSAGAAPNGLRQGPGVPAQGGLRQGTAPAAQQPANRGWNGLGGQSGLNARPQASPGVPAQNTRPSGSPAAQPAPQNRGGWQRFGDPGARTSQPAPAAPERQAAPQQQPADRGWTRFGSPQVNRPQPQAQPSYSAPRYSAPPAATPQRPSTPSYSAPSAPRYSAPPAASPSRGGGGSRGSRR